ncbi:MAG TPA: hypothetical protein VN176_13780 [Verrucomicrobiae bacterium]|jgi:DNA-directed RNA polymerase specialized sigma24 family protein|nr:hypothetical protein [Verrucomicrobiae bacterium]
MARTQLNSNPRTTTYTTSADFCRIFKEDMKDLHLLALLLTADPAKAEQVFVSGLDDCATGNGVFKEWAGSWARRSIIRNAVRLVAPQPRDTNRAQAAAGDPAWPVLPAEVSALFELQSFERFAFVMSVLEGYSDQDCALLLGCTRQTLIAARVRALQQVVRSRELRGRSQTTAATLHPNNSIIELALPKRLATPA